MKEKSVLSSYAAYLLDRRLLLLTIPTICLLIFFSISSNYYPTNPFSKISFSLASIHSQPPEIPKARVAVCLVGGARRFELTGPSIIQNVLESVPNSDLFLHSPLDDKAFKFSFLRGAPRIASIRIFQQKPINVTESAARVIDPRSASSGYQGLLQYFNLVEGCLTLIQNYQETHNITYDRIVRTRVDGYWSAPLDPDSFVPGKYTIPIASEYFGLNDRLGIGDLNTSYVALSRISLLPELDAVGFHKLNSEGSFRAQIITRNVSVVAKKFPFCVVSDRRLLYPPRMWGLPTAAMSSRGPLNGAYCRPCKVACGGECGVRMAKELKRGWSWIGLPENGTKLEFCDGHGPWEAGWEERFDAIAGEKLVVARKKIIGLSLKECIRGFREMKKRSSGTWEVPPPEIVCGLGLNKG